MESAPRPSAAAPRRIRLRRGLDLDIAGAPAAVIEEGPPIGSVAVLPADFPGLLSSVLVEQGESVRLGQPLVSDRRHPAIVLTSPAAGRVTAIHRGPRRSVEAIIVTCEEPTGREARAPDGARHEVRAEAIPSAELADLPRERVIARLLASGSWSALRSRPYGGVPLPDEAPRALVVTAMDSRPLAADPTLAIATRPQDFSDGLAVLGRLLDGPIYLCTAPGAQLPGGDPARIRHVEFAGPHPAGLPGTHIHFLAPVSASSSTWSIGAQDVMAIGATFTTGRPSVERVVSLCGPMVARPRLLRTRLGARLDDLLAGELLDGSCRIVSGSALDGRRASGRLGFLGRAHEQVTVLPEQQDAARRAWPWRLLGALRGERGASGAGGAGAQGSSSRRGPRGPLLGMPVFDRLMPLDVLPAPLLRALRVADDEAVEALGGLELLEEDLALCTYACPGKIPWGRLLRASLKRLSGAR